MQTLFTEDEDIVEQTLKTILHSSDKMKRESQILETLITIKASEIPNAGYGAFSHQLIPKGFCIEYKGEWNLPEESNCNVSGYRWTVFSWNEKTGEILNERLTVGFVDGLDLEKSNWTRYINCSASPESANVIQWQEFNKIFYGTCVDIEAGKELFVWYGAGFAKILGLKF